MPITDSFVRGGELLAVWCVVALIMLAGGCAHVPPIAGCVINRETREPIPAVCVNVDCIARFPGLIEMHGIVTDAAQVWTRDDGTFSVPSHRIAYRRFGQRLAAIHVKVEHPYYASDHSVGALVSIPADRISEETCGNLTFELLRLDDFLTDRSRRPALGFEWEKYFASTSAPSDAVTVSQAIDYWRQLASRFPHAGEEIQAQIRYLSGHRPRKPTSH